MKLISCYLTELLNVYKIAQTESIQDVVKDFIALGIIAQIDEVMYLAF